MWDAGYTYAAGLSAMRGSAAYLGAPPGSSFEVFGVDMLVDTDYRPWLVEINAVPSLARKVKPHSLACPLLLLLAPLPAISCVSPPAPLSALQMPNSISGPGRLAQ